MSNTYQKLDNFAEELNRKLTSEANTMPYVGINEPDGSRVNLRQIVIDEDTLRNGFTEEGRMSPVRRFYALIITFDLFFILLLWLICTVIGGLTIKQAFEDDVFHYNVRTSMFDVFMISMIRFTFLLLGYALFKLKHWWVVALTTSLTGAFLIAKVFLFNFNSQWNRSYTFYMFLIICSFVVSWIEAWYFDYRVVPIEKKALQIIAGQDNVNERSSLLSRYLSHNHITPSETVASFYSPLTSPADSDDEHEKLDDVDVSIINNHHSQKELEFKRKGKETLEKVLQIMQSDGWKLEKSRNGDTVHSKRDKQVGKIFLLSGEIEMNAEVLLEELFYRMEDVPKWNPTVLYCKVIQKIDSHTDICYNVAAEGAGGLVAPRDFVTLRHWELRDGIFISCGSAVTHLDIPPQKQYTRGENGPGAYFIKTIPDDPHRCHFQWLLNTNLKGWVPQYLVDQALSGVLLDFIGYLRNYSDKLEQD